MGVLVINNGEEGILSVPQLSGALAWDLRPGSWPNPGSGGDGVMVSSPLIREGCKPRLGGGAAASSSRAASHPTERD